MLFLGIYTVTAIVLKKAAKKAAFSFYIHDTMRKTLVHFLGICLLISCSTSKEKIPSEPYMETISNEKIIVYQIMTRLFGNKVTTNKTYGTIEENGVGKFNDINDAALASIKKMGITHVWYTGVLEHALLTDYTAFGIPLDDAKVVKGRAGSPYSIKDYYDVNPDLAVDVPNRLGEFDQLVSRTHKHDLKVIIDFIPNHVARKYASDKKPAGVKDFGVDDDTTKSFAANNNFYYIPGQSFIPPKTYKPLGGLPLPTSDNAFIERPAKVTANDQFSSAPSEHDWFEAVKLNYGVDIQQGGTKHFDPVPDTWYKMKDILTYWTNKKVDGFRCDMAEMVPVEFWEWVIPQIKAINPSIVFIAEIYNPQRYRNYLEQGRFDFLYDKVQLYDTLRLLVNGKSNTKHIDEIQQHLMGINHHMLHFLENHDEQRIASPYFAQDAWKAVPAMVVSALIDRGPVMVYFGQEVGEPGAGAAGFQKNDGRTTIFDYWGVPEHQKWMNDGKFDGAQLSDDQKQLRSFYSTLLNFAKTNKAISIGGYHDLTKFNQDQGTIDEHVHAFVRYDGDDRIVVVSNFDRVAKEINLKLDNEAKRVLQFKAENILVGYDVLQGDSEITFNERGEAIIHVDPYKAFVYKLK
jgi:glycosidase